MAEADLAVVAVPGSAFAGVVRALPGDCPVLSLTQSVPNPEQPPVDAHRGTARRMPLGSNFAEEIAAAGCRPPL